MSQHDGDDADAEAEAELNGIHSPMPAQALSPTSSQLSVEAAASDERISREPPEAAAVRLASPEPPSADSTHHEPKVAQREPINHADSTVSSHADAEHSAPAENIVSPTTVDNLTANDASQNLPRPHNDPSPSNHTGRAIDRDQNGPSQDASPQSRASSMPSMVFVATALENIAASKEAKRRKGLGDSVKKALDAIHSGRNVDPEIIFEPLRLATETLNLSLTTTALDCIGKLITYSYFATPSPPTPDPASPETARAPLIERAIDTICDCSQEEATPPEIQLQIVKSLLAAVLNDKVVVHGAGLLKAVRQVYNIFLAAKSPANQQVAQGTLTQMVGTVFERVKIRLARKETRSHLRTISISGTANGSQTDLETTIAVSQTAEGEGDGDGEVEAAEGSSENASTMASEVNGISEPQEKLTLQSFENAQKEFDDTRIGDNAPTTVTQAPKMPRPQRKISGQPSQPDDETAGHDEDDEDEVFVKDAFLVFRAMCRLSTKILAQEQTQDLRTQNVRSKLVSLSIIRTLMNNNMEVFTSPLVTIRSSTNNEPTSFGHAINQYLRLALSRNGASSVRQVFELSCEIFWLILRDMRVMMKREIEVFLKEIYLAILERRTAPGFQKLYIMRLLYRLAGESRALVELYLNYDCDRNALDNMFQKTIELLSRVSTSQVSVTPQQQYTYHAQHSNFESEADWRELGRIPPNFTTSALAAASLPEPDLPIEYLLKQHSLEALLRVLQSLVVWTQATLEVAARSTDDSASRFSAEDGPLPSLDVPRSFNSSPRPSTADGTLGSSTPIIEDDPNQLERAKQRKTALVEGIRLFNYKPKRGIRRLLQDGFIANDTPVEIATFVLGNDTLDKAMIGEFLGEGDPYNVAIMHAFVDTMDFTRRRFVDALRQFLQSFRLPGEAQKIDRFMLKFAERYMTGNPNAFANADTAYVLGYSVIMLNTDQHNSQMKGRRMTPEDFIKNNRGINDNADLPEEYLRGIYDEIATNEIVLTTEREQAAALGLVAPQVGGITSGLFATKDMGIDAAHLADQEMTSKAEQRLRSMIRMQRKVSTKVGAVRYIPATSFKHVGPMFDVTWMSFLSAFSAQLQFAQNMDDVRLCMEGFRLAIKISCLFDLDTPRTAFVTSLANSTNLGNLREMTSKNMEALKILLSVALTEGNTLKSSWSDILACVSQLDRLQLISGGVDEDHLPDMRKASITQASRQSTPGPRKTSGNARRSRSVVAAQAFNQSEIAQETRSADMIKNVDRIFSGTAQLNGDAIVHFVRALSEVSWHEIQSSGQSDAPRTYSLQKLVEISYYNMTRVRFEWANIWQVLGEHFNEVGCHNNTHIVFFALDSLRQLSMRFMEIEELPGFKFQKDFLKPFEHVMANSSVVLVKDMVLQCLIQMIQARGDNIRSGWKTMFGVFTVAAREPYEALVNLAFEQVTYIYNTRFGVVIAQGAFADLIVCLTEFSKNLRFQKKSLQAIETLKSTVFRMLKTPECPLFIRDSLGAEEAEANAAARNASRQTSDEQFWFPVLFAFHDVLMTGEDLEVRSQALNYLFDTLIKYGGDFQPEFWDTLWRQLLYPIFMVLKSKSEMSKVINHEDLSVWLSTTMIQALRNMIALFTHYFDSLEYMLERFLDLLALCICQENDTIARIGSNCLQTLILQNVQKFQLEHWHQIVSAFVALFERTTAHQLFSAATSSAYQSAVSDDDDPRGILDFEPSPSPTLEDRAKIDLQAVRQTNGSPLPLNDPSTSPPHSAQEQELEDYRPQNPQLQQPVVVTAARRRFFNKIITRCVLQLLMIETVNELFSNNDVYTQIPSPELLRLMALLKKSYQFAKKFNNDKELRMRLWHEGFMRQPPNLLKQESGSAATYVSILVRMYFDEGDERRNNRAETEAALIPLCAEIIRSYVQLDAETQHRNIVAWRPVVVDVMEGYSNFPRSDFEKHVDIFYPLAVELLNRDLSLEIRLALQSLLRRIGEVRFGMPPLPTPVQSPNSPRTASSAYFPRVGSARPSG